MKSFLTLVLALIIMAGPAAASQNAVLLERIVGTMNDNQVVVGGTAQVRLRVQISMRDIGGLYVYTNSFRIYSPDGGVWDDLEGSYLHWLPFGDRAIWGAAIDGIGEDTLTFWGEDSAGGMSSPMYDPFDRVAWAITIGIPDDPSLEGKTICIDSTNYSGGISPWTLWSWEWCNLLGDAIVPAWDGPHCITIVGSCCTGQSVGNVDCDPTGIVDLGDLTALIDHLFIENPPLCCPDEANIDGDPGRLVDLSDLTALVDFLFISHTPLIACPDVH